MFNLTKESIAKLSIEERQSLLRQLKKQKRDNDKKLIKLEAEGREVEATKLKYEKKNKLLFFNKGLGHLGKNGKWESNPIQKQFFESLKTPKYKIYGLVGANRISKTFSSTGVSALPALKGCFPWQDPEEVGTWLWNTRNWNPPIKIRIIGQDWEKHIKSVIIPTIQELWPDSWGFQCKKNNVGVEAYWTLPGYGTVEIMSNNSESDLFEGWNGHVIIYDEPPKRDNRIACARGLIDNNGIEIFAMTLLKEAWVDQEVVNAIDENGAPDPAIKFYTGDIQDNVGYGITQEGVDQFSKSLTDDEKSARLRGIPSYKAGVILNIDRNKHLVERFSIPSHWMVDVAIDIGVQKPHDVLYIATAPDGRKYVCFENTVAGSGEAIAEEIIQRKNRYNLRINTVLCDPLAKGNTEGMDYEHSTWAKIDTGLNRFGMYLQKGSKLKKDGVIAINDLLMTVNKMPMLFFFQDLGRTIKQTMGWMYDDKGLESKKDDDMCENLYRLILLGTEYEEIYTGNDISYAELSVNDRDKITGC